MAETMNAPEKIWRFYTGDHLIAEAQNQKTRDYLHLDIETPHTILTYALVRAPEEPKKERYRVTQYGKSFHVEDTASGANATSVNATAARFHSFVLPYAEADAREFCKKCNEREKGCVTDLISPPNNRFKPWPIDLQENEREKGE